MHFSCFSEVFRVFLGVFRVFGGCSWFSDVPECSVMFRCSVFRCSVFRCSWKYYMPFTWAELSSSEVRRLNQFETADIIWIGLAVLHARLAQPGITAVDRLWFRRRSSLEPNQIHKLIYGSSARISADRNLMHFYLLLNSVRLELRSASESIQPV